MPCHLRVQNIGLKTRDVLRLVPDTTVEVIERCSGHNGTYAVKKEFRAASVKIGGPVVERVQQAQGRPLFERLPDGGASDRERPRPMKPGRDAARARASDDTGAQGLRNMSAAMQKLVETDLLSLERYSRERPEFRARVIAHKKNRQVSVGPNTMWLFEDRLPCSTRCRRCCAPSASSKPKASPRSSRPTTR